MQVLAILLAKIAGFFLHLLHRGGSLPGALALWIKPNILSSLKIDCPIIIVSGTNGKTSTTNMISDMLQCANKRVISNRKGDNLRNGIATTLVCNASLFKKIVVDYIVLEVDELNIPYVLDHLTVTCLLITNFFRDQLDRLNELGYVIDKIDKAIQDKSITLVLNANDPNVVSLAKNHSQCDCIYFGVEKFEESTLQTQDANEGKFCPICGNFLKYDFYQYSHIGKYACSSCNFETPVIDVLGTEVQVYEQRFTYKNRVYHAPQEGIYSIYNCLAVLGVSKQFQVSEDFVCEAFDNFEVPKGRGESFIVNDQLCKVNLIKNPTGANEVIRIIKRDEKKKVILIILNDHHQDGRDISWIYDAHFDRLLNEHTIKFICSGTRAYEIALRLKYSDQFDHEVYVEENVNLAIQEFLKTKEARLYVMATYTALHNTRDEIERNAL